MQALQKISFLTSLSIYVHKNPAFLDARGKICQPGEMRVIFDADFLGIS